VVKRAYFARRFLALKLLRGALVVGALYDAGLAILLVWRPGAAAALLGLPTAGSAPLAALAAVWLVMLAGLGLAAARDCRRYSAVIAALIAGRLAAALVLATGAIVAASPPSWSLAWQGLLAVTLAAAWWPQRG
jgi:hypothetical protein